MRGARWDTPSCCHISNVPVSAISPSATIPIVRKRAESPRIDNETANGETLAKSTPQLSDKAVQYPPMR